MHKGFGPAACRARFAQRRRKQYAPPLSAARAREPGGNVPIACLAEDGTVMLEDRRKMTPVRHPWIGEAKSVPRGPVRAQDPSVFVDRQKQSGFVPGREGGHGPGVPKVLPEKALFDRPRRDNDG